MVWKSRKRFFGRERKDAGGHKKSLNGSGFNQRIDEAELAGEFTRVQPGEESPLDEVAPQLPVFLEQGGELRPSIGRAKRGEAKSKHLPNTSQRIVESLDCVRDDREKWVITDKFLKLCNFK